MDVTPFRKDLVVKVPVQHLFICMCNFLKAHHAKVVDRKLLDIEVTQDLVNLNDKDNIKGVATVLFAFSVDKTASYWSEMVFHTFFFSVTKTYEVRESINFIKLLPIFFLEKTMV